MENVTRNCLAIDNVALRCAPGMLCVRTIKRERLQSARTRIFFVIISTVEDVQSIIMNMKVKGIDMNTRVKCMERIPKVVMEFNELAAPVDRMQPSRSADVREHLGHVERLERQRRAGKVDSHVTFRQTGERRRIECHRKSCIKEEERASVSKAFCA